MSARDEILTRLRRQERTASKSKPWQTRRNFDNLADRFTASLTASHGEVVRAANLAAALEELERLLDELGARTVVATDEPPLSDVDFAGRWSSVEWHIVGRTTGDLRAFCTTADVGLSGATAALAETGSVVIDSGIGKSRLATLLPPVHLALVPTSCLTTDIFTWTAARQGSMPANVTLVSGPSKTADIEQTMAIGVHGPKRFIVLLYEN